MNIFLLDSFNLIFRAFYGMPELTRADGFPTGMMHGWVRTIWALEDQFSPDAMIAVMDAGSDEREALHPEYKANRGETPEPITQQLPFVKKLTPLLGIPITEVPGAEADDLIGVLADRYRSAGHTVVIVSADKDLGQLVTEGVSQLYPPPTANPRLGWRMMNEAAIEAKFQVRPDQIADYLALVGDSSDNIDGVPGVGPKTAAKWLNAYGNLEKIIQNAGRLKPPRFQRIVTDLRDLLHRNQMLTRLNLNLEVELPVFPKRDTDGALAVFEELEMKKAAKDFATRNSS